MRNAEAKMKTRAKKYLQVTEAIHAGRHRVSLSFNDGTRKAVDFGPFLRWAGNPEITGFRSLRKFKNFHLHYGNLMWGDYAMIFPITDLHRGEIS
jgi:hypothetical protein